MERIRHRIIKLPFGEVRRIGDHLAEVVISQGVMMSLEDVRLYNKTLADMHSGPFGLIVDKRYQYTYTFEAQRELIDIPNLKAVAILVYTATSNHSTRAVLSVMRNKIEHVEIFSLRNEAISWMEQIL